MPWKEKKIYFIPERWKWVGWGKCNKNILNRVWGVGGLVFPVKLFTKKKIIKSGKETYCPQPNSFPPSSTMEGLTSSP